MELPFSGSARGGKEDRLLHWWKEKKRCEHKECIFVLSGEK